jgi:hypothetical protein
MFRPRWDTAALLAATLLIVGINIACAVLGFTLRVDYGMTVLPTGEVYGLESQGMARGFLAARAVQRGGDRVSGGGIADGGCRTARPARLSKVNARARFADSS